MAFYLLVPVFVRLIRGCTSAFFCYVLALILRYLWVKTGYGDYMMIFYYLHYFLLGMLVWEIHQAGRRIGAQLLVYIGMLAAAGAVLTLGRAQTDSFIWWSWCFGMLLLAGSGFRFCRKGIGGRLSLIHI